MTPRQGVVDMVVTMVSLPLLVMFALMLEANMENDWTKDASARWTVLWLAMGLLFVSLMVGGYVAHRVGVCISQCQERQAQHRPHLNLNESSDEVTGVSCRPVSQNQPTEEPPSYESVTGIEPPPPYDSTIIRCDNQIQIKVV